MRSSTEAEEEGAEIWPVYEAFYIHSMLFNTTSAMRSIDRLERVFAKLPEHVTADDLRSLPTRLILDELQNMILQAGAISRYFWPSWSKPRHRTRASALCKAFGLSKEASALANRGLRDALEHFDERLDNYLASGIVGCIFPQYVGGKPEDDGVPGHFFRAYFVDVARFRLLDEEFDVKAIADELIFVHNHLVELDQTGGRLRPPQAALDDTSAST